MKGGMAQRPRQEKVVAYITQGGRLLVFRHRDAPEAGIQVPGGSIAPGETPAAAALREACEETGLGTLSLVACLGVRTHDLAHLGVAALQVRHYYHLRCDEATPERWLAWESDPSDGSPGPIAFELSWVPFKNVPLLAGDLGAMLERIGGREAPADDPAQASLL